MPPPRRREARRRLALLFSTLSLAALPLAACDAPPKSSRTLREPARAVDGGSAAHPRFSAELAVPASSSPPLRAFRARGGRLIAEGEGHRVEVAARSITVVVSSSEASDASLVLGPTRISRGGIVLGTRAAMPTRATTGELVYPLAEGLEERLAARTADTEQSWKLARAPEGEGDLLVRVPVDGATYVRTDTHGLVFERSDVEIRYGHAVFVEADGSRHDVPARYAHGAIELSLDESLLRDASYPAVLDPTIGAAQAVPAGTVNESPLGDQDSVVAAPFGATYALAVWLDDRNPVDPRRVYGARIDYRGRPSEARGLPLGGTSITKPAVACVASTCLVAYADGMGVKAVRVTSAGAVADATPLTLATVASTRAVAVETDGTDFVVAYAADAGAASTVGAVRVTSTGTIVDSTPLAVATTSAVARELVMTRLGTTYVVAWAQGSVGAEDIHGVRLATDGTVMDPSPVALVATAAAENRIALRALDSTMVLVYRDGGTTAVHGAYVDVASGLSASATQRLTSGANASAVALFAATTDFDLAWVELGSGTTQQVYRASVPTSGLSVLTATLVTSWSGTSTGLSVVRVPGYYETVLYAGQVLSGYDGTTPVTFGSDVTARNRNLGSYIVTSAGSSARLPYVGLGAGQYLLVQERSTGGRFAALDVVRFGTDGTLLDATPVTFGADSYAAGNPTLFARPRIAWDGSQFVVGYLHLPATTGELVFNTVSAGSMLSVGYGATLSGGFSAFELVDASGFVRLFSVPSASRRLQVQTITGGTSVSNATYPFGTYVTTDLAADRAFAFATTGTTSIASTGTNYASPLYAGFPTGFDHAVGSRSQLVVWTESYGAATSRILARLVAADGSSFLSGVLEVAAATAGAGYPRVAFDGTHYVIVWNRAGVIVASRVNEDGSVLDAQPATIATSALSTFYTPSIASDRAGKVLVAYTTFDADPAVLAIRNRVRLVDLRAHAGSANGTSCGNGFECASGFCTDGVCCESECGGGAADCQVCSVALGATADGVCSPAAASVVCRASGGPCDVAESCTGTSTACPADTKVQAGTLCDVASTNPCLLSRTCDGVTNACPAAAFAPSTTVCRPSTAPCDAAERCTGASATCPSDYAVPYGTVCRASAGPCDPAEVCNGGSFACPSDAKSSRFTVCRAASGVCDVTEYCDGSSDACPADAVMPNTAECRFAQGDCDQPDTCDGVGKSCPSANLVKPAGTLCRSASGPCDVEEHCNGTAPTCPSDGFASPSTLCRPAQGPCDAPDYCTGMGAACSVDAMRPARTICRPANGPCDVAELCSGTDPSCLADRPLVDGSSCDDNLVCNGVDTCQGGVCVPGEPIECSGDDACLESTGRCSVPTNPARGCSVATPGSGGAGTPLLLAALGLLVALRRRRWRGGAGSGRVTGLAVLAVLATLASGCVCGLGEARCGGDSCVDLGYDEANCGGCGIRCETGQCIEGACVGIPVTSSSCTSDAVCDDGRFCSGVERCVEGRCRPGRPPDCDDRSGCTIDGCDEDHDSCTRQPNHALCAGGARCVGTVGLGCGQP